MTDEHSAVGHHHQHRRHLVDSAADAKLNDCGKTPQTTEHTGY